MAYGSEFDRTVVVVLNQEDLKDVTEHSLGEMQSFICDALHAPAIFGPRAFVVVRFANYNQLQISDHVGGLPPISPELDTAAWAKVEYYARNAKLISREY